MQTIIFDFNRTLYDPDTRELLSGARELLEFCAERGFKMFLVSRKEGSRDAELDRLDIRKYFAEALFVERKDEELFAGIMRRAEAKPEETYVLGDYLHEEIRYGTRLGAKAVWLRSGRFAELAPEDDGDHPWRSVTTLREAREAIEADL